MSETIYRKVLCSDRLPEKEGYYITNRGNILFDDECLFVDRFKFIIKPIWWLEEIEINTIKAETWNEGFNSGFPEGILSNIKSLEKINPYK